MAKKRTRKKVTAKNPAGKRATKSAKSRSKKAAPVAGRTRRPRSKKGPLGSMRVAGERTCKALKSSTSRMVEGVKDTFASDEG